MTPRASAAEAALPPFDNDCSPHHEQGPFAGPILRWRHRCCGNAAQLFSGGQASAVRLGDTLGHGSGIAFHAYLRSFGRAHAGERSNEAFKAPFKNDTDTPFLLGSALTSGTTRVEDRSYSTVRVAMMHGAELEPLTSCRASTRAMGHTNRCLRNLGSCCRYRRALSCVRRGVRWKSSGHYPALS